MKDDFRAEFIRLADSHTSVGSLVDTFQPTRIENCVKNANWEAPEELVLSSSRSQSHKLHHTSLALVQVPNICWRHSSVKVFGKQLGCYET